MPGLLTRDKNHGMRLVILLAKSHRCKYSNFYLTLKKTGGKFTWGNKKLLGDVNKLFVFKSLLTMPINVLPLHLNQTFPPMIWIFTEGDRIESRLPFKIFNSLYTNWHKMAIFKIKRRLTVGASGSKCIVFFVKWDRVNWENMFHISIFVSVTLECIFSFLNFWTGIQILHGHTALDWTQNIA